MFLALNWELREYLHEFRENDPDLDAGRDARLPVLTMMILHANNRLRCWPSTDTLCKETGFGSAAVVDARKWLIKKQAIQLVPNDKREGKEKELPVRQFVYQITGTIITSQGARPYIAMSEETRAMATAETDPQAVEVLESKTLEIGEVLESKVLEPEILVSKTKGITSIKGSTKDQKHAPAPSQSDSDSDLKYDSGADTSSDVQRGSDPDFIQEWAQRGYKVNQIAYWWYPDGNKYVPGKIVKLTPSFAFFESVTKTGETITKQVGPNRCSVDGKTEGWTLVSELEPLQRAIATGSYGMTGDQCVSGSRMEEINMHRADLREQFKNGASVSADELTAAYGWHQAQNLHAPKERGKPADMVNAYRKTKPVIGTPVKAPSPHEEADPNCAICKGVGLVKDANRKLVPCDCRKRKAAAS